MTGEVTIDTIDIWTAHGAILLRGSYNDLLKPARRKASLSNNWPEQNGLEIDLAEPKYEAKDVDLTFMITASDESIWWTRYNAFFTLLKGSGQRSLYIRELGTTFLVYYKEVTTCEQLTTFKSTSLVASRYTVRFGIANPAF